MKFKDKNYNRLLLEETFNEDLYGSTQEEIEMLLA